MSISKLISNWRSDPSIAGNICEWRNFAKVDAQPHSFPDHVHPALLEALEREKITSLYSHQAKSWDILQEGGNVVIAVGVASGKSLCYNLPVIDKLLKDPNASALYLFPTKALAQDQLKAINKLIPQDEKSFHHAATISAIYDGDTPAHIRNSIRERARLLISNPDMLHFGILPHHTRWNRFLGNLKFIIIDEIHIYRGVFGSHVANVIRRLKRIANFYGASPQFILTSATIANPVELGGKLIDEDLILVSEDGSPHGPRHFLIYNPPLVDHALGIRRSALQESVRLVESILDHDIQSIIFARSRRSVELILTYLSKPDQNTVRGYRSGYLPKERREIEQGLRNGEVQAVVATTALELGIDIGSLNAALLVGYPGTIAAVHQQAGRAGRGLATALAILIATADPLDQFLAAHPEYIFERSPEQALINPDHPLIALNHIRCAAFELPFKTGENFGNLDFQIVEEYLKWLDEEGALHKSGEKYFWISDQYPAQTISLRNISSNPILLRCVDQNGNNGSGQIVGQVDYASALWMVHPQAIYLHQAQTYQVENLDLESNIAWLRPTESDYYTEPQRQTTVQLVNPLAQAPTYGAIKAFSEIQVTNQVTGYRMVRWYTNEILGMGFVDLPSTELFTTGYWLALEEDTVNFLRQEGLWKNDPIDYGANWQKQRNLARQRDGFRCQVCGLLEQSKSHDVHHKIPFRSFNSYQVANQFENLVTLCSACHRRAEANVRIRSGLAGLAYVLSHLAPFFLMCDPNDLGVFSDPQSPISNGAPTVVLYDQAPAGIGFSQRLFDLHDELINRAGELVAACICQDGCPSCVGPGGENGLGGKQETLAILQKIKKP
jgi:DEAD/DEAH box helicase domain-containing protein